MEKHVSVKEAVTAIREMFAYRRELLKDLDYVKKNYNQQAIAERTAQMNGKYLEKVAFARDQIKAAMQTQRRIIDEERAAMLTVGNAEEDFKLLALPVTLTRDELRIMVQRNQGNALFARAVAKYAQDHGYEDKDFRIMNIPETFHEQYRNISDAETLLLRYCAEENFQHDNHGEKALEMCIEKGLFGDV